MTREITKIEMQAVSGGFSIGSCSVDGSHTTTHDHNGNSSSSTSFHIGCDLNAPDITSPSGRHQDGGRSSRNGVSHSNKEGIRGHDR